MNDSSWETNKEVIFCLVEKRRQKECCLPLYLLSLVILDVVLRSFILLLCFKAHIRPVHSLSRCASGQMRNCVRIRRPSSMDRNGVALEPASVAARLYQKGLVTSPDFDGYKTYVSHC